jgi:predicted RNA-binding Zn-ribbon protein involved in translation (DUF1610 family)
MLFSKDKHMPSCVVCFTANANKQPGQGDFARFDCPRCGSFALSGTAERELERLLAEVPLRRALMSHTLRRMQRPDQTHLHIIESDELPTFWREERLPTPLEQADSLILLIGDNSASTFCLDRSKCKRNGWNARHARFR